MLRREHEAVGRDGPFDVDALGAHRVSHGCFVPIVGDVDALLATVEAAHPDEGNGDSETVLRALEDQGLLIVWPQPFEGRPQRRVVGGAHLHER
jgi:hypothetical protein